MSATRTTRETAACSNARVGSPSLWGDDIIAVRHDHDEGSCGYVDIFVAPTSMVAYGRGEPSLRVSPAARLRNLAKAHGRKAPDAYRLLQDLWAQA